MELIISPKSIVNEQNETIRDTSKNLEKYDEYPGWLWDSDNETWIPDQDNADIQ